MPGNGLSTGALNAYISLRAGARAIIIPPLATLAWVFMFPRLLDPLYTGMALSLALLLLSLRKSIGNTPASFDFKERT
ncbi:MAG: hypothetical protein ACYC0Q_14325 [Eubacteriales bacterium]